MEHKSNTIPSDDNGWYLSTVYRNLAVKKKSRISHAFISFQWQVYLELTQLRWFLIASLPTMKLIVSHILCTYRTAQTVSTRLLSLNEKKKNVGIRVIGLYNALFGIMFISMTHYDWAFICFVWITQIQTSLQSHTVLFSNNTWTKHFMIKKKKKKKHGTYKCVHV